MIIRYGVRRLGRMPLHDFASLQSAAFCVGLDEGLEGGMVSRGIGVQSFESTKKDFMTSYIHFPNATCNSVVVIGHGNDGFP
jgi:hypothetical protein